MTRSILRASSLAVPMLAVSVLGFTAALGAEKKAGKTGPIQWQLPTAAAAAALGEADGAATSPAMMRRFHVQAITRDKATGFAFESSPYLVSHIVSIDDYQRSYANRILPRLQVSGAVVDEENGPAKASLGLKWTVFNESDPYVDLKLYNSAAYLPLRNKSFAAFSAAERESIGCLGRALMDFNAGAPLETPFTAEDDPKVWEDKELQKLTSVCIEAARERSWDVTGMDVSVVQLWSTRIDESLDRLAPAGLVATANASLGFSYVGLETGDIKGQVVLNAHLGDDVLAKSGATFVRRDELGLALKARAGSPRLNFSAEAAYSNHEYAAAPDETEWSYTVAGEYEVTDGLWFVLSMTDRSGDAVAGNETRATGALKWAFADQAQFGFGPSP